MADHFEDAKPLTLQELCRELGVSKNVLNKIPSSTVRTADLAAAGADHGKRILTLLRAMTHACAKRLMPGDPDGVLAAAGFDCHLGAGPERKRKGRQADSVEAKAKVVVDVTAQLVVMTPQRSQARRVLRALLVKSVPEKSIVKLQHEHPRLGILHCGKARAQAYKDYNTMECGGDLKRNKRSLSRFLPLQLHELVQFQISHTNVSSLSWGSTRVKLSKGEIVTLPVLLARRTAEESFDSYEDTVESPLSRTMFYRLSKAIIKQKPRLQSAVDYCTGILVHEPVAAVQDVIDYFFTGSPKRKTLTELLTLARNFLKVQYDSHSLTDDDEVCTHGIKFALSRPLPPPPPPPPLPPPPPRVRARAQPAAAAVAAGAAAVAAGAAATTTAAAAPAAPAAPAASRLQGCKACNYPSWLIHKVIEELTDTDLTGMAPEAVHAREDAKRMLNNVLHKFKLYYGHRCRVVNQSTSTQPSSVASRGSR